jgi:hypothetical protein
MKVARLRALAADGQPAGEIDLLASPDPAALSPVIPAP